METVPALREVTVQRLGRTEYDAVHRLQATLREQRIAGASPDTLLLTEHEPVFTLGRSHPAPDLRVPRAEVERAGIGIVQTERGGDITYHGPGQLVAYAIVDLRAWGLGAVDYVAGLERCAVAVAARFGVTAEPRPGARGAWSGGRKLASIGLHVRRGVTMHGIAINVAPDFDQIAMMNPCGMDVEMTGLAREGGRPVAMAAVEDAFVEAFCAEFRCASTVVDVPRSRTGARPGVPAW